MDQPLVSIVVVTSDRLVDLRRCLTALHEHTRGPGLPASEILTVHAPHDHAAMAMVRHEFPEVTVHVAAARHISQQRNLGARMAKGVVLAYIDDDAWPHTGWLRELTEAFTDPRVVAASGPVRRGDGSFQCERLMSSPIGRLLPRRSDQPLTRGFSPSFSGCNLALRRSALFACGGFDENLSYQPDDMDVCGRLFARVGRDEAAFRYCPGAVVTHESSPGPYRRTLEDRAWYVVARDNVYYAFRHGGLLRGAIGGGLLQVPKLLRFGRWLLTGKLGPLAFVRCLGKHVAGTAAGYAKGLLRPAMLPLRPLPDHAPPPTTGTGEPQESSACRRPQPV